MPDGVISESVSDSSAQLVIDSKTVGGHEIKYRATTEKGKTKEFTVTVVDEDHIEIEGNDKIAIPLDGEDNEQYTYTATVIGTDGQKMNRNAFITSSPACVSLSIVKVFVFSSNLTPSGR